ncbi:prolyl oligopeptidase family serine peptidase [Streptomyces sp. NPDC060030]|uniref:prolyl oligopeptidase family serine peptidase n=1 Tax=Streptomyces sp. NPDC060030 TaxID=3347042 RepID=UPI0036C2C01D
MSKTTAPFGSWLSPITAEIAASGTSAGQAASPSYVEVTDEAVWWLEPRGDRGGRTVLMQRLPDGEARPVLAAPWDVRSRVIEYGGRPWTVESGTHGTLVVFVNFADQRLYAYDPNVPGTGPRPLSPVSSTGGGLRWAEPEIDLARGEVRCLMEQFTGPGPEEVRRVLAAVPLDGSAAEDLSAVSELHDDGYRFISGARYSPDGTRAVWLAWDHPHMPWEAAELRIADIGPQGAVARVRTLIGGSGQPVAQAEWAADGSLLAACERTNWWNLYRVDPDTGDVEALLPASEDFAGCQRLGLRWFVPLTDGRIAVLHGVGAQHLSVLDPGAGRGTMVDVTGPWSEWLPHLAARGPRVIGVAASSRTPFEVVEIDTTSMRGRPVDRSGVGCSFEPFLPEPTLRVFTGSDGRPVHTHIYAPRNPDFTGPADTMPPYVIWAHGGPGLRSPLTSTLEIAYFNSRGIGVADVNYGGTPGYGKEYRERLRRQWGVVDVADCEAVARGLIREGLAAEGRVAIRGHSAGGFTAAASLASSDVYACAVMYYPVLDLLSFSRGLTHDFESHYLVSLIGSPTTEPERYKERSPSENTDRITSPFLLFQGLEDAICPPEQSRKFLERASRGNVSHGSLFFEDEGHGFRDARTMIACLEKEITFYGTHFAFTPPGIPGER